MKKETDIGLIFSGLIIIAIGITLFSIFNEITSIELTQKQIESIAIGDFISTFFLIPAISLPIATIVGWKRIQKVWFKNMPWLIICVSIIIGLIGLLINIVF